MQHAWNYSPFGSSNLKYYVKTPPSISGPEYVCSNTTSTFTMQNLPAGVSPSWTVSSGLEIINNSGNSVSVRKSLSSDTDLEQWVRASYQIQQGVSSYNKMNVTTWRSGIQNSGIGQAVIHGILSSYGGEVSVSNPVLSGALEGSNFTWSTSAINWSPEFQGYYFTIFDGTACGPIEVSVNFTDACGASSTIYKSFDIECPPYFTCSPNPASNTVTITFDQAVLAQKQRSSGKLQKSTFDVRLYDSLGNQWRQASSNGGNVELNVSGLLNGIYFVHIYDGINTKPEIRKIIVKH